MYYYHFSSKDSSQDLYLLLKLVIEVIRQEAFTELTFDYLKVIAPTKEEENLLDVMLEDEREHFKELKKIYYSLTGQQAEGDAPQFEIPDSYLAAIDDVYNQKLEILKVYKKMRNLSPYLTISEKIADFIHDELRHLTMLNHILINNYMKDRVYIHPHYIVDKSNFYS